MPWPAFYSGFNVKHILIAPECDNEVNDSLVVLMVSFICSAPFSYLNATQNKSLPSAKYYLAG